MIVGAIVAFAGPADKIPKGWHLCDGSAVNTMDYLALYQVIGDAWGAGEEGVFCLPDLQGYFLRGVSGLTGRDPDADARTASGPEQNGNSGNNVGSCQMDAFASHQHTYGAFTTEVGIWQQSTSENSWTVRGFEDATGSSGGSEETRPKNVYVNFIICHTS